MFKIWNPSYSEFSELLINRGFKSMTYALNVAHSLFYMALKLKMWPAKPKKTKL